MSLHGDLYPFNVLLTEDGVRIVDWPHAWVGAAHCDVVTLLSSASLSGVDPHLVDMMVELGLAPLRRLRDRLELNEFVYASDLASSDFPSSGTWWGEKVLFPYEEKKWQMSLGGHGLPLGAGAPGGSTRGVPGQGPGSVTRRLPLFTETASDLRKNCRDGGIRRVLALGA